MSKDDHAWTFFSWLIGFATFVAVTVAAQYVARELYTTWWNSTDAVSQPIPDSATMFLDWVVGGGVGLLAAKFVGDHV